MTSECHDVMSLLSLWIWNHKDCFALVPGMTRARALYPWMVIVNNNKRVKPMAGHSNYTFVHISRHRTRTCCRDVTRETCGNFRLTESFLLTLLAAQTANKIYSLQKMVVVLAVVAVLLGAAEARIAGSLGEGWHYLAPGLELADLLPPPTRSPRQIIGSRSVWTLTV